MLDAVTQGILFGVVLSALLGPIFFTLIETSIKDGIRSAIFLDLGVLTSDVLCILVAYYGASSFLQGIRDNAMFFIGGGMIFIAFGVIKLLKKNSIKQSKDKIELQEKSFLKLFFTGFGLNIINPGLIVFWLGMLAISFDFFDGNGEQIFVFFAAIMLTYLGMDLVKIYLSNQLKKVLNEGVLWKFNRAISFVFIAFGLWFIYQGWQLF